MLPSVVSCLLIERERETHPVTVFTEDVLWLKVAMCHPCNNNTHYLYWSYKDNAQQLCQRTRTQPLLCRKSRALAMFCTTMLASCSLKCCLLCMCVKIEPEETMCEDGNVRFILFFYLSIMNYKNDMTKHVNLPPLSFSKTK